MAGKNKKDKQDILYEEEYKRTLLKLNSSLLVRELTDPNFNKFYFYDPVTQRLEEGSLRVLKQYFKDSDKLNKILNLPFIYNPGIKNGIVQKDGRMVFNTYNPPFWKVGAPLDVETIPDIYKDFFEHLTFNLDEDKLMQNDYNYIVDWVATSLYPSRYLPYLCFVANKGVGKGLFGNVLKLLHGDSNSVCTSQRLFNSQFNSQILNKTIIHLDEIKIQNEMQENILKLLINNSIEIEGKKKDAYNADNFAKIFITTNNYDIFKITHDERRYSIPYITSCKIEKDEVLIDKYISPENFVNTLYNPENIKKLGHYLLNYANKITRDFSTPHKSERTVDIIKASLNEWEMEILTVLSSEQNTKVYMSRVHSILKQKTNLKIMPGRTKISEFCNKIPEVSIHFDNSRRERYLVFNKDN